MWQLSVLKRKMANLIIFTFILGISVGLMFSMQTKVDHYPKELLLKAELQAEELGKFNTKIEVKKFIQGTYIIIINIKPLTSIEMVELDSLISTNKNDNIHYLRTFR